MDHLMAVLLNGIAQIEFDRNKQLSDYQLAYLEKMRTKMDQGITVGELLIENPDENQRAEFVAANLYHAIQSQNEAMCSAMTSYLAHYMPDLKQVKMTDADGKVSIELVFDETYGRQVPVTFITH